MKLGPVGFLFVVIGGWVVARAWMLWPDAEVARRPDIAWAPALPLREQAPGRGRLPVAGSASVRLARVPRVPRQHAEPTKEPRLLKAEIAASSPPSVSVLSADGSAQTVPLAILPSPSTAPPLAKRFSISAWALLRADVAPGLATAGQLGGSQTGIRARYRVAGHLYAAARLSAPVQSRPGKEAAIGFDWRPLPAVPITVSVERRIGLDRGGRNAFGLGVFGGFDRQLAPRLRVDGYGQTGIVGVKARDAYVDGALRVEHDLVSGKGWRLGAGAGAWGGAQPSVSRLDIGPQLVGHISLRPIDLRIGAEWRQRVAGGARPGSGPVLSLGADF